MGYLVAECLTFMLLLFFMVFTNKVTKYLPKVQATAADIPSVNLSNIYPKLTKLKIFPKTSKACFWNMLSSCVSF